MKAQNPYVNCWILGQTTSWSLQPSAERIITPSGISQGPAGATWNSQAAETPGDPGRTVGACHWENNEKPWDFGRFPMTLQRSPEPRAFKACPPPYSRAGPRKAAPFLRQVMALAKAGGLRMCAVPEYMIVQTSINHRYDRER